MDLFSHLSVLLLASCAPSAVTQVSASEPGQGLAPGSQWLAPGSERVAPGSQRLAPGSERVAPGSQRLAPSSERVNVIASRFSDLDGGLHQIGMRSVASPAVLVFLDPGSQAAERLMPRLKSLASLADQQGVEFFGVFSNSAVSVVEARAFRKQHQVEFPLLFDASGELAHRLGPTHMPECFVVAKDDTLAYRGRIQAPEGEGGPNLQQAIEAVAQGTLPPSAFAAAIGERFEAWPDDVNELELTYNRNIAPILEANCIDCHRTGDVGPFALDEYKNVKRRSRMILFACEDGIMPPWQANPKVNLFREQRIVSEREIDIIRAWALAKCPEGDPSDLLPSREQHAGDWRLGEPDMILNLPAFDLPAEGADVFQNFVIPSGFTEGKLVVAVEFRPKAKSVLHHMGLFVDDTGSARAADEADPGIGFSSYGPGVPAGAEGESLRGFDYPMVRGWVPGQEPFRTPKGLGVPLPPGCDFVISTHYHLDGTAVTDQSQIGIYFGDEKETRDMFLGTMLTNQIYIPAGEKSYKRHVMATLPVGSTFHNVTPHMHNLGASVDVWATPPGGERMHLLQIDRWDYRWQNTYTFHEPLYLPKGTLLESIHYFDNSAENPENPSSPPEDVTVGWYTNDEMCMLYFNFVPHKNPKRRRAFFVNVASTVKED